MFRSIFESAKAALREAVEDGTVDDLVARAQKLKERAQASHVRERWFAAARKGGLGNMMHLHQQHPDAVHWQDAAGNTALLLVAKIKHPQINYDCCTFLRENGADVEHRNHAGETAAELGMRTEYPLDPIFSVWEDDLIDDTYTSRPTQTADAPLPHAPPPTAARDGVFAVNKAGFVLAERGRAVAYFEGQKQVAQWILKTGHAQSLSQRFEVAVHPGGEGYAAKDCTVAAPAAPNHPGV